jgi:hypothetical protein
MNNLDLTYDFIRKSEHVKNDLIHMTDNVMDHLKYKGVEKLAKMLKKHKIITFFNQETDLVFFVKETNPYLKINSGGGYFVGVVVKDEKVVSLPYTKLYY